MILNVAYTTKEMYAEVSKCQAGDTFNLTVFTNSGVTKPEKYIVISWEIHEELISGEADILLRVRNIRTGEDVYILPEKEEE